MSTGLFVENKLKITENPMRSALIFLLLFCLATLAQGSPMPEQTKKDFIKSGILSCLAKQRQDPLSKYMTEAQLTDYCTCTMTRAADSVTLEDLGRVIQTKSNASLIPIMESAGNYCVQSLLKKWGLAKEPSSSDLTEYTNSKYKYGIAYPNDWHNTTTDDQFSALNKAQNLSVNIIIKLVPEKNTAVLISTRNTRILPHDLHSQ